MDQFKTRISDEAETFLKVKNLYINAFIKIPSDDKSLQETLKALHEAFVSYITPLQGKDDFPFYKKGGADPRFKLYLQLVTNLTIKNFDLPRKAGRLDIDYSQPGWPLSSDSSSFESWCAFIRTTAELFQKYNFELDTGDWVVTKTSDSASESESDSNSENSEPYYPYDFESTDDDSIDKRLDFEFEWNTQKSIDPLINSIQKMYQYGKKLHNENSAKGEVVMNLATNLYLATSKFYSIGIKDQEDCKLDFERKFREKLHSKDEAMASHRKMWKVIVGNILLALTGVGLLALGINLLANRQLFFSATQSTKNVNEVENNFDYSIACK